MDKSVLIQTSLILIPAGSSTKASLSKDEDSEFSDPNREFRILTVVGCRDLNPVLKQQPTSPLKTDDLLLVDEGSFPSSLIIRSDTPKLLVANSNPALAEQQQLLLHQLLMSDNHPEISHTWQTWRRPQGGCAHACADGTLMAFSIRARSCTEAGPSPAQDG